MKEVKEVKKSKKSRDWHRSVETFKTVLIAVLITGIVSFMAGAKYQAGVTVVSAQVPVQEVKK